MSKVHEMSRMCAPVRMEPSVGNFQSSLNGINVRSKDNTMNAHADVGYANRRSKSTRGEALGPPLGLRSVHRPLGAFLT